MEREKTFISIYIDIKTGIITEINKNTQSEWSAHANWKNSSRELNGDFQISSRLVLSDKFNADKDLVKLSQQASSDKLIEVANSLKEILSEKNNPICFVSVYKRFYRYYF